MRRARRRPSGAQDGAERGAGAGASGFGGAHSKWRAPQNNCALISPPLMSFLSISPRRERDGKVKKEGRPAGERPPGHKTMARPSPPAPAPPHRLNVIKCPRQPAGPLCAGRAALVVLRQQERAPRPTLKCRARPLPPHRDTPRAGLSRCNSLPGSGFARPTGQAHEIGRPLARQACRHRPRNPSLNWPAADRQCPRQRGRQQAARASTHNGRRSFVRSRAL